MQPVTVAPPIGFLGQEDIYGPTQDGGGSSGYDGAAYYPIDVYGSVPDQSAGYDSAAYYPGPSADATTYDNSPFWTGDWFAPSNDGTGGASAPTITPRPRSSGSGTGGGGGGGADIGGLIGSLAKGIKSLFGKGSSTAPARAGAARAPGTIAGFNPTTIILIAAVVGLGYVALRKKRR